MAGIGSILGAAVGAAGSLFSGAAQAAQLRYQADVARWQAEAQARNMEYQAKQQLMIGRQKMAVEFAKAEEAKRNYKYARSAFRTRASASGFIPTSVTDIALQRQAFVYGGYTAPGRLRQGGRFVKAGYQMEHDAGFFRAKWARAAGEAEAQGLDMAARTTMIGSVFNAFGSLIGGFGGGGGAGATTFRYGGQSAAASGTAYGGTWSPGFSIFGA